MPKWTDEQKEAIYKEGTNIIVSAGAGSGKTAVLTERVLEKVKKGISVDNLLILTFTKMAAKEMRERIGEKLKENGFTKELSKLDTADITTFDAYALSLVKKYHYYLNLSKDINIIDASVIGLYKEKMLKDIFEELYTSEDSKFLNLIKEYALKDDKEIFNFILNNTDNKEYKNIGLSNVIITTTDDSNLRGLYIIILAIILVPIIISLFSIVVLKGTRKLKITRKEEFLKYNDMLTNLKNRNYLNANIEKWDDTKVYPRTIIVIDLNNLKYVNDNYGHEEGNNLIKKAGAILINTQLEKSEIIRTDGNEFLIYLIGYSKSQISTYISKLSKEFEKLPYNFGAAIGYSMIEDEIKTIDDAINEATIDMRKDKENYK